MAIITLRLSQGIKILWLKIYRDIPKKDFQDFKISKNILNECDKACKNPV
jgi:hypothetical protein